MNLLICTVGGSPEPIVASIRHWEPSRVLFVPTKQTADQVATRILPLLEKEGLPLGAGCYEFCILADGQDLAACLETMRELAAEVERWLRRGSDYQVVVDFTGGTKCMSAALALHAHRWPCLFSYVGGTERTRDGVGVVVSGTEQVVHAHNPWDALGYQAVEQACMLFDERDFGACQRLLEEAIRNTANPARKRELNAINLLAKGYQAWDRFEHARASELLSEVLKYENDFLALLMSRGKAERLASIVRQHAEHVATLKGARAMTLDLIIDLLANARRRASEGRFDDAVARLYRAIEAIAQVALRERHGIENTGYIPLERLPESLQAQWTPRAAKGAVRLGLQDAFSLLREFVTVHTPGAFF